MKLHRTNIALTMNCKRTYSILVLLMSLEHYIVIGTRIVFLWGPS